LIVQVRATAVDACKRLGRYRMPFCWTAIELAKIFRGIPLTGKQQCCGSGSAWIRIILGTRIRIPIKYKSGSGSAFGFASNKNPDPDSHQYLQMKSQNVWNMSLFEHFFKGLRLYLEAGAGSG
jgi:hypothetical protein